METKTIDIQKEMSGLDQKLAQWTKRLGLNIQFKTKLYPSAKFFHKITAFKIYDSNRQLIPFAYDNGHNLTEDGYITRHLLHKYPNVIKETKQYRQHPETLKLGLNLRPETVKQFASQLFTIEDVRYFEINVKTANDNPDELALTIIMFSVYLNHILTNTAD
ncbi:hypothetical protein [Acetilactobacillus jinshanensis]|uniref:Uncharacterized protein n=1 Tax=Acetilactobacillus jinshanensis TaxID=1720083 RepID=A0A4P6ZKQ3_9LACO|nr:hypothetical protein [Acetilactobacillus jinshanensis]QBP18107.1 hypothetical protein ELX58_02880 [Acetilactobacillus jinshanensis]URL60969.1 EAL domain-containing protein [uncultured bacterium]